MTNERWDHVGVGLGAVFLLHVVLQGGLFTFSQGRGGGDGIGLWSLLFIGVSQLIYVVPLALYFRGRRRPRAAKGVWIAAAITFLLNAACYGLVFAGGIGLH